MPTLARTQEIVDTFITDEVLTVLTARQQNFHLLRGRYWQANATHSTPPAHTGSQLRSQPGDRLTTRPDDAFDDWGAVFPLWVSAATLLPCLVRVDVYEGPDGQGWVLWLEFRHNGNLWRKIVNVGPESHRTKAWHLVLTPGG